MMERTVTAVLIESGAACSLREAQRLIVRGGVRLNDHVVDRIDERVTEPATLSVEPRWQRMIS